MVNRRRIARFTGVALLLTAMAACSGDDPPDSEGRLGNKNADKAVEADADAPVVGSFVGKVSGTRAFVAVVAAPAATANESGAIHVYLSDGRGLSEWFSGSISDGGFVAQSDDGDAKAEGELGNESVTGTIVLPDGTTGRYEAKPPSGGAGLYDLTVSSGGELAGASAAGLAVRGEIQLQKRGSGKLKLVDGQRLELALTRKRAGDLAHLRAGHVRLIVLSDGELRGVGKARPKDGAGFEYFIRSA